MAETFSEDVTAAQQPADWNNPCSEEHLAESKLLVLSQSVERYRHSLV